MSERSVSPYEKFGVATPLVDASLRIHVVTATDTISNIAYKYFGDWQMWPMIADRNAIADVRTLVPGTQLVIPARPLERGKYESL